MGQINQKLPNAEFGLHHILQSSSDLTERNLADSPDRRSATCHEDMDHQASHPASMAINLNSILRLTEK